MKYICTVTDDDVEEIFMFPRSVDHDAMMESLEGIKDTTRSSWARVMRTPVSAGFVSPIGRCHGKSITLGISSRDVDTDLLIRQYT